MNLKYAAHSRLRWIFVCSAVLFVLALSAYAVSAQGPANANKLADANSDQQLYQTFFLTYATDQESLNDITTDLRNMIPRAKVFGVESQKAITLRGTADDIAMAQKLIADLDKPRKVYRLTYTITDKDSPSESEQHYSMIVASGDRTVLKQGDRVPIITGLSGDKPGPPNSQVQYVDVGVNINAALATSADSLTLNTKLELSSVANPTAGLNGSDPDIQQTVLQESSTLVPGRPLVLGSIDTPGAGHHEEVEVLAELVK